jgi:crotonobetainyl-CoA:carnitine CoA-transferase CaiB-like acyl-CoA transferase
MYHTQAFKTKDQRYFVVGAGTDAHFIEMCNILSMTELNNNEYRTNALRVANRDTLINTLQDKYGRIIYIYNTHPSIHLDSKQ